jgi:peptidoglycan/xylan/chitin deacetylase (PgdA/CDA1 family)
LCFIACLDAQTRQVAITFDDLPRGGDAPAGRDFAAVRQMTRKLTGHLKDVPVTGFVNPGRTEMTTNELLEILALWTQAGAELGNHTHTHPGLNETPLEAYTADILAAEPFITKARGGVPSRYFRHPYLQAGPTLEKKQGLQQFLHEHGYTMAPVTLDNCDWMIAAVYAAASSDAERAQVKTIYLDYMDRIFAFFEGWSREVNGRELPQILLLHANQLNADTFPDLLALMKRRGYSVVPLADALADPAYAQPETYVGRGGFSWLHRWARTKGLKPKGEPEDPPEIVAAFGKLQR